MENEPSQRDNHATDDDSPEIREQKKQLAIRKLRTESDPRYIGFWLRPPFLVALMPLVLAFVGVVSGFFASLKDKSKVEMNAAKLRVEDLQSQIKLDLERTDTYLNEIKNYREEKEKLKDDIKKLTKVQDENEKLVFEIQRYEKRHDAIESANKSGATVVVWASDDSKQPFGQWRFKVTYQPLLNEETASPDLGLEDLRDLGDAADVRLLDGLATDRRLRQLQKVGTLSSLWLDGTFTIDGLTAIESLKKLESLTISSPNIDDSCVEQFANIIKSLPQLRNVSIRGASMNSTAVDQLDSTFPKIEIVGGPQARVDPTDKGIRYFIDGVDPPFGDGFTAKELISIAWNTWMSEADIPLKEVLSEEKANVIIRVGVVDGKTGGRLGRAHIGPPGNRQLIVTFDVADVWTTIKFQTTATYLFGQILGIRSVDVGPNDLMGGTYVAGLSPTRPTSRDIAALRAIWGPPKK
ncbi:MAG: hypothetical protein IH991_07895 [Planctomycetes bacterium]|nr:hypothetical protein [Planctomycetota bacterium]